jgi:hypothetical protein
MAYCCGCGKALGEDAKFCSECGVSVPTPQPEKPLSGTNAFRGTGVIAGEPKRGGRLALQGFALSFVLALIAAALTRNETTAQLAAIGISYAGSAAFIAIKLCFWQRHKEAVKGATVGWTVALLLSFVCLAVLMNALDTKRILLNDVALDFRLHKEGLGTIIADFTVRNPTRHRFKDFEITCTHSAASGTVIDSNTNTIYQTVEPESQKIVDHVSIGLIPSQAQKSDCKITDLVPLQ